MAYKKKILYSKSFLKKVYGYYLYGKKDGTYECLNVGTEILYDI